MHQALRFCDQLAESGVPAQPGCDGAYLRADRFLAHLAEQQQDTLSAALYLSAGLRAVASGRVGRDLLLPVQIPRLVYSREQLSQVAEAIGELYEQRERIQALSVLNAGAWQDEMRYRWVLPDLEPWENPVEPWAVHTIERSGELSREQRRAAIVEAGYNSFLLPAAAVAMDLLTDSGTSAASCAQHSERDRALGGSASEAWHELVEQLQEALGYEHIIPVHQGRAAEHILSRCHVLPGQQVPGNAVFITTRLHQQLAGGVPVDVAVGQAHEQVGSQPWRGEVDLARLQQVVREHGADRVAYLSFELASSAGGGQPARMDNLKQVYAFCSERGIPVFFDATRCAEAACLIQQRDPLYQQVPVRDILHEMFGYADGCTASGKKDLLAPMGGFLAYRDNNRWKEQAQELLRAVQGAVCGGGLSAADMAAMAQGVEEMLDDRGVAARIAQVELLGRLLLEAGVPILEPPGSHAIYLDARRFLPHVDQDDFPAQRLAAEIYVQTGARVTEAGNASAGRDPDTGENLRPQRELVRIAIPRRVYSDDHMRSLAAGIAALYLRREEIQGLRVVSEPAQMRIFTGRYEGLEG